MILRLLLFLTGLFSLISSDPIHVKVDLYCHKKYYARITLIEVDLTRATDDRMYYRIIPEEHSQTNMTVTFDNLFPGFDWTLDDEFTVEVEHNCLHEKSHFMVCYRAPEKSVFAVWKEAHVQFSLNLTDLDGGCKFKIREFANLKGLGSGEYVE